MSDTSEEELPNEVFVLRLEPRDASTVKQWLGADAPKGCLKVVMEDNRRVVVSVSNEMPPEASENDAGVSVKRLKREEEEDTSDDTTSSDHEYVNDDETSSERSGSNSFTEEMSDSSNPASDSATN